MPNPIEVVSWAMKRAEFLERNAVYVRGIDMTYLVNAQMEAEKLQMREESAYLTLMCSRLREVATARI